MQAWEDARRSLQGDAGLSPVYTLVGSEFVLQDMFMDAVQRKLSNLQGATVDIQRVRYEDEGPVPAILACQSYSLFSPTQFIVLEGCSGLTASPKSKYDLAALEDYLDHPIEDRVLMLTVHADKLDERKKVVKRLRRFEVVDCTTPKEETALRIIVDFAKQHGWQWDQPGTLSELWRRTGSVSGAVRELEKLAVYAGNHSISEEYVKELVAPPLEDNVFQWIDAVVKGNINQAFQALADVQRGGADPFSLMALMARQVRLMWWAKVFSAKGYSQQQIASKASAHPYAVRVAAEQAKSFRQADLESLLVTIADAEFAVKSGRRDPAHSLEWVILSCSAAVSAR